MKFKKDDILYIVKKGLKADIANLIKDAKDYFKTTGILPKKFVDNLKSFPEVKCVGNNVGKSKNFPISWVGVNSTKKQGVAIDFDEWFDWKYSDWTSEELQAKFAEYLNNPALYKSGGKIQSSKTMTDRAVGLHGFNKREYGVSKRNVKVYNYFLEEAKKHKAWAEEKKNDKEWMAKASDISLEMLNDYLNNTIKQIADYDYEYLFMRAHAVSDAGYSIAPDMKEKWEKLGGEKIKAMGKYSFSEGGDDYSKNLGFVKVKFENPKYNYFTNVSGAISEQEARDYFIGKYFNVETFPSEKMAKVTDIEFSAKGTYKEGGGVKKSLGGVLFGAAAGVVGTLATQKILKDKNSKAKHEIEKTVEKELSWQEDLILDIDKEGFDYTFTGYSDYKNVKDKKFHELRKAYVSAYVKLNAYIQENLSKGVKDAIDSIIDKEGFDYTFTGYSDWKNIKVEKFHELRNNYISKRKSLAKYIGLSDEFKAGGSVKRCPEKGTPEWHRLQVAKQTIKMNPSMISMMGGMSLEEAKKVLDEYNIKYATGGSVSDELISNPSYKYQNILKRWFDNNDKHSLKYKVAVLLLKGEKDPDEILKIKESQYDRILRSLDSISESKHEMSWRTNNFTTSQAEQWVKESLEEKFLLKTVEFKSGGSVSDERLEEVLRHYVMAALWSSYDENDQSLDANYGFADVDEKTLDSMRNKIKKFITENHKAIEESEMTDEQLGHDLWLSSNGHGSGFFDRGYDDEIETQLMEAARKFGTTDLEVGDDGHIYAMGVYGTGGEIENMTAKEFLDKYFGSNVYPSEVTDVFEIKSKSISDDNKVAEFISELKKDGFTVKKKSFSEFTSVKGAKRKFKTGGSVGYEEIWYEDARNLIEGEFSNEGIEDAFTRKDVEKLAVIITDLHNKGIEGTDVLEHNKVQDYLSNLSALYKNKMKDGGSVSPEVLEFHTYVLNKYNSLLPSENSKEYNTFTYSDFADRIRETYDITDTKTKIIFEYLKHLGKLRMFNFDDTEAVNERMKTAYAEFAKGGDVDGIGNVWTLTGDTKTLNKTPKGKFFNKFKNSDSARFAKPAGYRFKGEDYTKPSLSEIKNDLDKPKSKRDIYWEARPQRSDKTPFSKVMLGDGGYVFDKEDYELARNLIDGEFENENIEDAFTKNDVEKLAEIINNLQNEGIEGINLVEHDKVQDYLSNLSESYKNKMKDGGEAGRGWGKFEKGQRITNIKNLKVGSLYLMLSPQFNNAKNIILITSGDKTSLNRDIVYASFVRDNDLKSKEEDFAIWEYQLEDNYEIYEIKGRKYTTEKKSDINDTPTKTKVRINIGSKIKPKYILGIVSNNFDDRITVLAQRKIYTFPKPIDTFNFKLKDKFDTGGDVKGHIFIEEFEQLLGHKPGFPYQYYDGHKYEKKFMKNYYVLRK